MTTPFSWSDTVKIALGSCMPCLRPVSSSDSLQNTNRLTISAEQPELYNPAVNRIPRARPDELQGLLADSSDNERAETLSLHSNPGRGGRRRKRRSKANTNGNGKPRRITLFGFDLFGRPPPIQLPPDDDAGDDDAPLFRRHHSSSSGGGSTPTTTLTTQTFDSDAAPLDISTIQSISVSKATEAAEAEAKRLKEKEERRQRRKAKKEMKRLVEAGVVGDGEEFEGFQGSGGLALLKRPSGAGAGGGTTATSSSGSHSHSRSHSRSQQSREGFGHFVSAPLLPTAAAEEDDENADLDGSLYARKNSNGAHSNGGTSDSRRNRSSLSRTSASASDRPHHTVPPHQHHPNPGVRKSKHSSTSQSRSRSNTSSQSPSLQSPSSPAFSDAQVVSPSTVEQGQGFFDLEDNELPVREEGAFTERIEGAGGGFPVGRIGAPGGGGFPMTGFGGGGGKRSRDFGAFLARRGDGEDERRVGDGV
ncbi:uncharacterized protein LACBIDRAFT_333347 [Laccaria bicolor S238N-H82]|uniref:Predicted protein n=1 Tax=Laccaria bicolor (strain S238N-H82 / ATCC MYA-4686) TaxID=486041 RepID=B0DVL8_LACBS|nr:uncharacterized protein LACBIDRAFT_333347 [Laccaria bicolor S238N-H82]EDR01322.1 predicted protein [Laccaria bicolor S238N-H82]|eukprot:XP_001888029.1 predicted protein [Laccaria bicolor S238N-H82]